MPRTLNIPRRSTREIVDDLNRQDEEDAGLTRTLARTPPEAEDAGSDKKPVDGVAEPVQLVDAAQVSEGDVERAIQEKLATKLGWTPQDQWKRDPAKWRDAAEFLEDTPRQLEAHKERARRAAQAAEAAFEDERRRVQAEAEAAVRAAADAQDPDAAAKAAKQLAANSGPSARVQAWVAERSWYRDDPAARAEATKAGNVAAAAGLNEADQLEAADMAVRKRYPEYFGDETPPPQRQAPKDVPLSEIRRPPAVNPPSRGVPPTPANKEKGYGDLPHSVRQDFERHLLRKFTNRGLTTEDAQARYAKSYWHDN